MLNQFSIISAEEKMRGERRRTQGRMHNDTVSTLWQRFGCKHALSLSLAIISPSPRSFRVSNVKVDMSQIPSATCDKKPLPSPHFHDSSSSFGAEYEKLKSLLIPKGA
jgi:hypothetical protein